MQFPCPDYRALFRDVAYSFVVSLILALFPCPDYRALFRDPSRVMWALTCGVARRCANLIDRMPHTCLTAGGRRSIVALTCDDVPRAPSRCRGLGAGAATRRLRQSDDPIVLSLLERVRGDRILHEALTIGPDPLHLAMVFNLSHTTANRYAAIAQNLLDDQLDHAAAEP